MKEGMLERTPENMPLDSFFNMWLGPVCKKSVNTAKKNVFELVKMPSLNLIGWKLTKTYIAAQNRKILQYLYTCLGLPYRGLY